MKNNDSNLIINEPLSCDLFDSKYDAVPYLEVSLPRMTSRFIVDALRNRFKNHRQWVTIEELVIGFGKYTANTIIQKEEGGFERINAPSRGQRIDFYAIDCFDSHKFERIAIEIKVTRSDYLSEMKKDHKQVNALTVSNTFYYVVPYKLIHESELPDYAGLIYVNMDGQTRIVKKAPWRECQELPIGFVASMLRRVISIGGTL